MAAARDNSMARKLSEDLIPEEAMYENLPGDTDAAKKLMSWLQEEHTKAQYAYSEYFEELKVLRRAIAARPATKIKTFPWPGASNLIVPLIRIAGDAVKARVVNTLLAPKPFWVCSASNGSEYGKFAKPIETFMEWVARNDINLTDFVEAVSDQIVYLGKCPIRISWEQIIRKVNTYNPKTGKKITKIRTVRDSPSIMPVLLEDWLEPWGIGPSESKAWNSYKVRYTLAELREKHAQGLILNFSEVETQMLQKLPPDLVESSELQRLAWADTEIVELYETHTSYDFDNDGFREEMIVLWHHETALPLQLRYNFFWHGYRPVEIMFYLRDSFNRSTGSGIANLLWPLQEAMSTFVNQRSDNITIANTRFWKGKRGEVKRSGPNSQIFPGQVMLLNDPVHDLVPEKMGDVTPSAFTHESMLRDYAERLSGISDPQLGREFNNPRVAATTTLSVLQEGNRRFDMVVRLSREVFSRVGMRVFQLYQQFKPRVPLTEILNPEDAEYVEYMLNQEPEVVESNFQIQLNTSTAMTNKETQRQGLLALHQLITQFYGQVIEVATQIMANPQFPDPIKDMIIEMSQASYNTIKEIVMSYDITDPSSFLIDVAEALNFVRGGGATDTIESDIRGGLAQFPGMGSGGGMGAGADAGPVPQASGISNESQLAAGATGGGAGSGGGGIAVA